MAKAYLERGDEDKARRIMGGIAGNPEAPLADMVPEALKFLLADFRNAHGVHQSLELLGLVPLTRGYFDDKRPAVGALLFFKIQINFREKSGLV